jgi:parallel beta-helix repeat protein
MFQYKKKRLPAFTILFLFLITAACSPDITPTSVGQMTTVPPSDEQATTTPELIGIEAPVDGAQVLYDLDHTTSGLVLEAGSDADTKLVSVGSPPERALRTGNGRAMPASDGNTVEDYYMQFNIDDTFVFQSSPTSQAQIEVEYFDKGTDTFNIQYDATSGGPDGDGRFKETDVVVKTDSRAFKTTIFQLDDAYFGNRINGGDFRINDNADGPEAIRRVIVTLVTPTADLTAILVDSCGANPFDNQPDSSAIQTCIDKARDGDTILFTSGVNNPDYQGYVIDKTIFLVRTSAKTDLTFSSTDPENHALLWASPDLLGFVVRLFARSRINDPGNIDNIAISHLDLDGNRAERKCFGADGIHNGNDDNWGSWLPECNVFGDSWCIAGTLGMHGELDWGDPAQDYLANPSRWSTGLVVDNLGILQTEYGTALALSGADSIIRDTTIDTAGEHVHVYGCSLTDDDEGREAWADGITYSGPSITITGNTILNPTDIGITLFGGKDTIISNNTVKATSGNYGMFAAINIGPVTFSDVSGGQVVGNRVINEANETCGGIHAGIDIGPHMWGAGCLDDYQDPGLIGNPGVCLGDPPQPKGSFCEIGESCQIWAYVAAGSTFTLKDNYVSGAQVNYLIEGLDLVGTLVESGNTSSPPRMTDWAAAKRGGERGGVTDTWGTIDRVAHHPTLDGWVDQRIHCER